MEPIDATNALLRLALQFQDRGCHPQAAKCLQAVCSSNALPATKATARLLLGQLLLDHTHDIAQAKEQLSAAELLLRSTSSNYLLRCETFDSLARCHLTLGALPQQREAYLSGLAVCRQGAQSKDREALARWAAYFHFRLAEYSLARDSAEEALRALQGVAALGNLTPKEQALSLLARTFLHLHTTNHDAATADLRSCREQLDALPDQAGLEARQLRVHMLVLGTSLALATGNLKDLELEDNQPNAMLSQVQHLLNSMRGQEWCYGWMPPRHVEAVVALLQGSAFRSIGKMTVAARHLNHAEKMVDQELGEQQFDLQKDEGTLTPHSLWGGKAFALLKLMLLEQHALVKLVATDFAGAAQHIDAMLGAVQRFPTLLRDFVPSVRMLQGFYAQSVGEYAAAAACFKWVLDSEACSHLHTMAAATAALCELQRDGSQAGPIRALELLQGSGLAGSSDLSAGHVDSIKSAADRAVLLLVMSMIALRQGDSRTASLQLARALKMSHNTIGNTQLVGAVLVALAPVQLERNDVPGAQALLDSAFTILKGIHDLPSMLCGLDCMAALQTRMKETEKLERNREYAQRKAAELKALLEAARATEAHKRVLQQH